MGKKRQPPRITEHRCQECNVPVDTWGYQATYGPSVTYERDHYTYLAIRQEKIFLCRDCARKRRGPWWNSVGSLTFVRVGYFERGYIPHRLYKEFRYGPKQKKKSKKVWKRVKGRQQKLSTRKT